MWMNGTLASEVRRGWNFWIMRKRKERGLQYFCCQKSHRILGSDLLHVALPAQLLEVLCVYMPNLVRSSIAHRSGTYISSLFVS